ncbi:hypothetical protein [Streptomyces sp. NPDC004267]|uniref:hypothetical protein n=1 Tax=Streptomyces sp. NPDC004267 TaxID=3364694 RepID=UPI00369B5A2D
MSSIEATAVRRGRTWVAQVPKHGVYGHGTTLKRAHDSVVEGLALVGVTAEVKLVVDSPELEKLRAADTARAIALAEVVAALLLRRTALRDIAFATGEPVRVVKSIIAEHRLKQVEQPSEGPAASPAEAHQAKEIAQAHTLAPATVQA